MDAVTGLSGSGPAYVFLVAEALVDAGVLAGLDRETSAALTDPDDPRLGPPARRVGVAAGGAAGRRHLARRDDGRGACGCSSRRAVRAAFLDAVAAATERSRELGGS